jgi:hypothetical protein
MTTETTTEKWLTSSLAVLTIIISVITSIPSFIALNRDRPLLFHSISQISVLNPAWPNYPEMVALLHSNKIPTARCRIDLLNNGDAQANEVRIGIAVSGPIAAITTVPDARQKPVWAEIPTNLATYYGTKAAQIDIRRLAPTKVLRLEVAYFSPPGQTDNGTVDAFFDGKPSTLVGDIGAAPRPTILASFRIPLLVLGIGMGITLGVAAVLVLRRNRELADAAVMILRTTAKMTIGI